MAEDTEAYLKNMARDIQSIKSMMTQVINYMTEAEKEVSEKMRRFIMYMHDLHDVTHMYEERGLVVPPHVLREMERVDDRFRHLLEDSNVAGGTFEQVRREMTKREGNRWDHSKFLPKETPNAETSRPRIQDGANGTEDGTQAQGDESGSSERAGDAGSPDSPAAITRRPGISGTGTKIQDDPSNR